MKMLSISLSLNAKYFIGLLHLQVKAAFLLEKSNKLTADYIFSMSLFLFIQC